MTIEASVKRETEKAILVSATIDTAVGLKSKEIWLPKSCSKIIDGNHIKIKDWLWQKKNEEIGRLGVYGLMVIR